MDEKAPDFKEILRVLVKHQVEFVVVGGVGAVLQGAPIATFDLDIVHERTPENIERLLTALRELGAYYRPQASRKLLPDSSHLKTGGHQLLITEFGPLDVLGPVGADQDYADLIKESEVFEVGETGFPVLKLDGLIRLKEATGHAKDRAVLEILRAVREEKGS